MNSPALMPIGNGFYLLLYDFEFGGYVVPAGFVTDLDSIRRWPILYWWLKSRTTKAAIVHDYLYSEGGDRKFADDEFLRLMRLEKVRCRYRWPIYQGVRFFGGSRYQKLKAEKQFVASL